MTDAIWFLYDKNTGEFMGSGVTFYDTDTIASTRDATPEFNGDLEKVFLRDNAWVVTAK